MSLTVKERDALLKEMLPVATALVCAVHDRDGEDIAEALAPLEADWLRTKALVVALAALVPDDQPFGDLAAWTFGPVVTPGTYLEIVGDGSKECVWCEQTKPLEEFSRDKTRDDGRRFQCKQCQRERRNAAKQAAGEVAA